MNLSASVAASILAAAGLRMPPFSASLEDRKLRQLCWRVIAADGGECMFMEGTPLAEHAVWYEPMIQAG